VDARIREGVVPDDPAQHADLRLAGLEKTEPRGRIEEEILHRHRRPHGAPDAGHLDHRPAQGLDLGSGQLIDRAGGEHEPRDLGDARERLTAESQRTDPAQIRHRFDLARGVPAEREERVLAGHSRSVVLHPDQALRVGSGMDGDEGASRVEGILDQLLHHGGGTIDDLPGPDGPHDRGIEEADAGHRYRRERTGNSRGKRDRNSAPDARTTTSSSRDTSPCPLRWMLGSSV